MAPEQEQTLYTLPRKFSRVFIPKFFTLILLSAIFYSGILLNLSFLSLRRAAESQAKTFSLGIIIALVILGIAINFVKAKTPIIFLQTKLKFSKHKSVPYAKIDVVEAKQNISDKIFRTYHIKLDKKHTLEGIPKTSDPGQITTYINQLVASAKQSQMNYNSQSQYNQNQYNQSSYSQNSYGQQNQYPKQNY
ncbi:hypothetical protein HOC01_06445 [archaeon]|jgi:hypothetical protein|nr:hypothetical protein [archaeon]MBT6697520.1 hypothetical protein [archaeon]